MCKSPKAPKTQAATPPPEAPKPLALPEMRGLFGAGLRASTRNGLKARPAATSPAPAAAAPVAAPSGLTATPRQ